MKRRLTWVTLFSVAIVLATLYHVRRVHATQVPAHHHACSVASLRGAYALHLSAPILNSTIVVCDGPKMLLSPMGEGAVAFVAQPCCEARPRPTG
jgi:hypothetical protein